MNILQINSSARSQGAVSTLLANEIVARLRTEKPHGSLTVHELAQNPVSPVDEAVLQALMISPETRTPEQAQRIAEHDARIAEVQSADVLVLGAPMYNFGVTSQLKNWIDSICRAGVTFRYTEKGPEGLLKGKRAYVALARGGMHRTSPLDTQVPYLRTVLGFLGIDDVQFVYAEGLGYGEEAVTRALAAAREEIATLA
ncbi:FMN-dependent NADH-azoreductase [Formivibrio citricus]|uniref:FMN dependent NADH:quinone oxidoreductase n=1 Tax=Formivibrio citricus TaxID=83765 RepID=A0A1I4VXL6_9NEIS|nr:NAD(P)H-dependent oxidoreductase [Formivibrio citricus]SFN05981.1 FMN-dependent NADH-azoreductase [Formivibrio citricus]